MAEYIEREAAFQFVKGQKVKETGAFTKGYNKALRDVMSALRNNEIIPAAAVRPIEPARWVWDERTGIYRCEKCGRASPAEDQEGEEMNCTGFCPNCGADMRET